MFLYNLISGLETNMGFYSFYKNVSEIFVKDVISFLAEFI